MEMPDAADVNMFPLVALPTVTVTHHVKWQYTNSDDTYWKDMPQWYSDLHEWHHLQKLAGFFYNVQYCKGSNLYVRFVVNSSGVDWKPWFPASPVSMIFGVSDARRE